MKYFRRVVLAALALIFAQPALAQVPVPTPLVTPNGGFADAPSGGAFTMGFSFTVSTADPRYVVGLGAYDSGGDGFAAPMTVGLWDNSGNLLLQATVTSSDGLNGSFRYTSVAPYLLTNGQTYVLGAFRYAGAGETYATVPAGVAAVDGLSYGGARYNDSGSFAFPNVSVGTNGYFGANALIQDADAVPEPGTWAMLILGFGVIGGALRRRSRLNRSLA